MFLEAIWLKDGKEVFKVEPVMNIVCDDEMRGIADIEVENGYYWYSCADFDGDADDFVIRLVKDK